MILLSQGLRLDLQFTWFSISYCYVPLPPPITLRNCFLMLLSGCLWSQIVSNDVSNFLYPPEIKIVWSSIKNNGVGTQKSESSPNIFTDQVNFDWFLFNIRGSIFPSVIYKNRIRIKSLKRLWNLIFVHVYDSRSLFCFIPIWPFSLPCANIWY